MARSLPPAYFDELYGKAADPWKFESSPYESAKFAATLAALPRARYGPAFEVGCSIGVLTRALADRCESVLAVDVAEAALAQARERCRDAANVRFGRMALPEEMPDGPFDLVLLSEVAYYWTPDDFDRAFGGLAARLGPGGQWLMVHWIAPVPDYPQTGEEVHDRAIARAAGSSLVHLDGRREERYRVDLFGRAGPAA